MGCIMFIGTPRGAFTPILKLFVEVPPRVFPGILSEYISQKYGQEQVNKDFGDFLVTAYIVYRYPPVAHAWGALRKFLYIIKVALGLPYNTLGGLVGYFLNTPQQKIKKILLNTRNTKGSLGILYLITPLVTQLCLCLF